MKASLAEILEATKGSIIISCQALPSEPMYCEEMSIMPFFANAAKQAGSKCIRTSSIRDVVEIKKATGLAIFALIPPTLAAARNTTSGFSFLKKSLTSLWIVKSNSLCDFKIKLSFPLFFNARTIA